AEGLFARQGYAATSIKQIGDASQRNTALIHYYFESKELLYKAVLRHALEQVVSEVGGAIARESDPERAIRGFVRAQLGLLRAKPHLLQLMVREMSDWGATHAEDQIHTLGATVFHRLCSLVEKGQRDGRFRRDADPRFTAISLVAQMNWMFMARPAVGVLLGRGLGQVTAADVEAFAAHAADLVIAGLRVPATSNASARKRQRRTRSAPRKSRRVP
ncbi:MAG: TetR/AcrR family transcriptional regulator, partial [Gemmatimonadaceae bacterium]